jgi:hypothetical protein
VAPGAPQCFSDEGLAVADELKAANNAAKPYRQKEETPYSTRIGASKNLVRLLDGGTSGISARPNLLRNQLAIRALVPLIRALIVEGAVDALLGLVHCLFHPGCKGTQRRLRHEG